MELIFLSRQLILSTFVQILLIETWDYMEHRITYTRTSLVQYESYNIKLIKTNLSYPRRIMCFSIQT